MYTCMYVACSEPSMRVNAAIHIDANMRETTEAARRAVSALLTKYEFRTSLSLVRAGNKTFLETQFSRFYEAEDVNRTGYDQVEILAKAYLPTYDYLLTRRAFLTFITSHYIAGKNINETTVAEEVDDITESCNIPPKASWSVTLHTSKLSSSEYTPVQLPVSGFMATLRYIQDCTEITKKCDGVEQALYL